MLLFVTLITNETEALEAAPVTVADNIATRWDFDRIYGRGCRPG